MLKELTYTIKLNPDIEKVKEVREALARNNGYCPCKIIKNTDTRCICKESREQDTGYCHCELYYKI